MSNETRVPEAIMSAPARIKHVGGAWGFAHYEALVLVQDAPTIAEVDAAGAQATLAAHAADGQNIEEARVLISGGRLLVVVRFSRPDEA